MLITFQPNQEEYKEFTKFALRRASGIKSKKKSFLTNFIIWFLVAIVFMFVFQALSNKNFNFDMLTAIVVLLPLLVGAGIYFYEMSKLQKNTLPKVDGFLLTESTLEIKEDGIHASNKYAKSFFKWEAIESVSQNGNVHYLFLDNVYAIIVPNSAFANANEADEFRGLIEKYV